MIRRVALALAIFVAAPAEESAASPITSPSTFTEGATVEWEKTYEGGNASAIAVLPDGGALIGGSTYSRSTDRDWYLLRVDEQGKKLWSRTYGGEKRDWFQAIAALPDGGALLAGVLNSGEGTGEGMFLLRVDADGQELWGGQYGKKWDDQATAITVLPDGGALLAGYTYAGSPGVGGPNMQLIRLDANGGELWSGVYGGDSQDISDAVAALPDGGALLAGYTYSGSAGASDMGLVRVNANGEALWAGTYGGAERDAANAVAALPDGGALIAGYTSSSGAGGNDMFVVRVDADGQELWSRTFGGVGSDSVQAMAVLADGGALLAGVRTSGSTGTKERFLVRVDDQGRELWSDSYGTTDDTNLAMAVLPDGGLLLAGRVNRGSAEDLGAYVLKLSPVN